jgi:NitT/TauT family transport system substrate-binding protein
MHVIRIVTAVIALGLASSAAVAQQTVRIGVATSGGTTLPALVISQQKLDEKHGVKIEWVRLGQGALQKGFALRQFDVSFAQVATDLIRQRARGDQVTSIYSGIMANVYVVTRQEAPYQEFGELKGKKVGLYSLTSGSTAALTKIVRDKWGLDLRKDFELVVSPPPVLAGLLQKGEIEAMVNVDPLVLKVLHGGGYRQIMDLDSAWQENAGSRLLVTTIAVWDEFADANPELIQRLVDTYREAVEIIARDPQIYVSTGFIKDSRMEATPDVVKSFEERFAKLYTGEWNKQLIDANRAVFEVAIETGNLESIPDDWYSFEYAK